MSDFIPQEIILQILYRLPVKTLVKFTLVCKSWQSLITSSFFINTHLAKTLSKPVSSLPILIRHFTDSPKKEHYFLHLNHESLDIYQTLKSPLKPRMNVYPRIVGTVHGLICLSDDLFVYTYRIVLWNPLVRKCIELPRPNITFDEVGPYMFTLGFGFDAKKNDYKVVRLVYPQGDNGDDIFPPKVEVFSVAEKGWRMLSGERLECSFLETRWTQCFLSGRVHWIVYEKKMGRVKNWVLLFDMEDEKFRKMKLPESMVDVNPMKLFISVSRGMLTVFEYYLGEAENKCCNIWVRTEYGDVKSWSKLYNIDVLGGAGRVYGLTENGEVFLAMCEGGGGLQSYADFRNLFEVRRGELVLYDPKSRETKVVQPYGVLDAFFVGNYTESLVLLNKEMDPISYEGAQIEVKRKSVNPESGEGTSNLVLEEDRSIVRRNDGDEEEEDDNVPAFGDL
ncbi:hypothetical protein PTKIN_Ptkin05aG0021800 [Pterospermum kingtungense]